MNYFDKAAATWDDNPLYMERSKAIFEEMVHAIPLAKDWHVLEYGCGTGLLSILLQPYVASIVLADDSQEMLNVLKNKILSHQIENMQPLKLNLLEDSYDDRHDLIYTQMALHHIRETETMIGTFYNLLNHHGYLCIADLVEEDGTFHAHHVNYDAHNGFNTDKLKGILAAAGFIDISVKICFTIERKLPDNTVRKYPIFLMIGKKS